MTCEYCGGVINSRKSTARFCCRDCKHAAGREIRECVECGAEFNERKSKARKTCSKACVVAYQSGVGNPHFKGGLSMMRGYVIVTHRDAKQWTYLHRAIVEAHIGRALRSDEIVHHVNHDRTDNRIENLQVVTRAEHLDLHRADHDRSKALGRAWATRRAKAVS